MKKTISAAALALTLGTAAFTTAQSTGSGSGSGANGTAQSQPYGTTERHDDDHDFGWIGLLGLAGLLGLRRRPETHTVRTTTATPDIRTTTTR